MKTPPSLAFFVPAYNEADNLQGVVSRIYEYCDTAGITQRSVIVIDDGSSDHTGQILADLKHRRDLSVVSHASNQGYGAALRSGFRASLETGHSWITFCDADGQFDPMDLHRLFSVLQINEADVAIGYREQRADNMKRQLLGRAWHLLSSVILGYEARDVDCGFKLFSRESLLAIERELCGEHATISPEILTRLQQHHFLIVEEAVPHYPRAHGEQTGANLHVAWNSLIGLLKVRRLVRKDTRNAYSHLIPNAADSVQTVY